MGIITEIQRFSFMETYLKNVASGHFVQVSMLKSHPVPQHTLGINKIYFCIFSHPLFAFFFLNSPIRLGWTANVVIFLAKLARGPLFLKK